MKCWDFPGLFINSHMQSVRLKTLYWSFNWTVFVSSVTLSADGTRERRSDFQCGRYPSGTVLIHDKK